MHRIDGNRIHKCVVMGSNPLDLYAREYFNSLNSIARKISTDITTTVAAYEDLWHTLSIKDKHQVINETIIHPEVTLKYAFIKTNYAKENLESDSYCNDEGKGIGWKDEHAAPFSWKTQSQQDLSIFCDDTNTVSQSKCDNSAPNRHSEHDTFIDPPNIVLGGSSSKHSSVSSYNPLCVDNNAFLDKMKSKSVVLKVHTMKELFSNGDKNSKQFSEETNNVSIKIKGNHKTSKTLPTRLVSKPKNPPPPPPPKSKASHTLDVKEISASFLKEKHIPLIETQFSSFDEDKSNSEAFCDFHVDLSSAIKNDELPKTGFDFLDNW